MAIDHELGDTIARCVLDAFNLLPAKRKPRGTSSGLAEGQREWVPLAGIVLEDSSNETKHFSCVSLATGMKCLPENRLNVANGNVLHDCHAEILAIRAFNRYLLDQVAELAAIGYSTTSDRDAGLVVERSTTSSRLFRIRDGIRIHMYCSEAPCGDASMELIMNQQDDPTPWTSAKPTQKDGSSDLMLGRGYFSELGVVRRKPSRPDAPPTLSKSCSDKLALRQCTSLLSTVTTSIIDPANAYLSTVVLPDSQIVPTACERAFSANGRMKPVNEVCTSWSAGYSFQPFTVVGTSHNFTFSRQLEAGVNKVVPSNLTTIAYGKVQETLINGVLQGRKQSDPKGASSISRRKTWEVASAIAKSPALSYNMLKQQSIERIMVKEQIQSLALRGWIQNDGDSEWMLE